MWLTNRKAEWRAQRKRRSSLAGQDKVVEIETPPSRKRSKHTANSFDTRKEQWTNQRKRKRTVVSEQSRLDQKDNEEKNMQLVIRAQRKRRRSVASKVTNVFVVPQDKDVSHLVCVLIV